MKMWSSLNRQVKRLEDWSFEITGEMLGWCIIGLKNYNFGVSVCGSKHLLRTNHHIMEKRDKTLFSMIISSQIGRYVKTFNKCT